MADFNSSSVLDRYDVSVGADGTVTRTPVSGQALVLSGSGQTLDILSLLKEGAWGGSLKFDVALPASGSRAKNRFTG